MPHRILLRKTEQIFILLIFLQVLFICLRKKRNVETCHQLTLLFSTGAFVSCGDVDDAVGVDIKSYLNLRHTARRRRKADLRHIGSTLVQVV